MATNASGAIWHLAAASFANAAGIEVQYVPYPSGGAAMATATAGGEVDVTANSPTEVKPLVDAGELRILAVQSEERHPAFPDVPTVAECGIDTSFAVWRGIFCPEGYRSLYHCEA
jgi:tripartite-type tricarboxylate transporter receptor subunit TctC